MKAGAEARAMLLSELQAENDYLARKLDQAQRLLEDALISGCDEEWAKRLHEHMGTNLRCGRASSAESLLREAITKLTAPVEIRSRSDFACHTVSRITAFLWVKHG